MSEGRGISLPGAPSQTPGLPENFTPIVFELFAGLNTKPPRPGIKDEELYWDDGFMPIGPNNARTLYGTGAPIFEVSPAIVVWFGFGNLADQSYCYALTSDGAIVQINPVTSSQTPVLASGSILAPTSILGFSQWGSQYIIFAKDQENGYWLWDGTNIYTAGTVGPQVTIDNGGSGYVSTAIAPQVITNGAGGGEALSFQIDNGAVVQATVTNPGHSFGPTDQVVVALSGGGTDASAWAAPATVATTTGGLSEVFIIDGGQGYSSVPTVTITGSGTGASISLSIQNGVISGAAIVSAGTGYTSASITLSGGGGSGANVGAIVTYGQVIAFSSINGGSGYTAPPTVKIIGDGTGATAIAQISGGVVTGILMTNNGSGYSFALADLVGGNNAAHVTLELMPFGVSGTWVEVYEGHDWVGNGAAVAPFPPRTRVIFSAPDSPVDFGDGGGAFKATDSFVRIGYYQGKQANGFLYLIGDSSMNYISGVQTTTPSGTSTPPVPVTTFGNLNVDPQIGSPWPSSVQVFSRNIVMGNTVGVYVSYGGAIRKISDPLDGFYSFGPIYGAAANFSSAVAHIFGIPVYMLLLPVHEIDLNTGQFTGSVDDKLLMWDGRKWFCSHQDRVMTYIATQEINSVLTAWATDGHNIFQLFATPTSGFTKVMQSKLFSAPMYASNKTSRSLSGIINFYSSDAPVTITIDSEGGQGTGNAVVEITPGPSSVTIAASGQTTVWTPPNWGGTGIVVFGPVPVGQQGRLIGLTVETDATDVAILSLFLADQVSSPNV